MSSGSYPNLMHLFTFGFQQVNVISADTVWGLHDFFVKGTKWSKKEKKFSFTGMA